MKVPTNQESFDFIVIAHNLVINPAAIPKEREWVLNENGEKVSYHDGEWYIYSDYYEEEECLISTPKIWYEIPKFDNLDLESLSKEELIALIIKERGEK